MTFAYSVSLLSALTRTVTPERLTNYLVVCKGSFEDAIRLYAANTQISETFYAPLQGIEIALRNAINTELVALFGVDWITNGKVRFSPTQQDQINSAKRALADSGKSESNGGLVGELNFGFWVGLLGPKYEPLWRIALRRAFPNRPRRHERKEVQGALNAIRRLRNRVAHHERILHRNLADDHALILKVIGWICAETTDWIKQHSRFDPSMIP